MHVPAQPSALPLTFEPSARSVQTGLEERGLSHCISKGFTRVSSQGNQASCLVSLTEGTANKPWSIGGQRDCADEAHGTG